MAVLALRLAYDGTAFHGWARQPGLRTVEQTLGEHLDLVVGAENVLGVRCAGRTDTGVHAEAQVVSVVVPDEAVRGRAEPERVRTALLTALPGDLAVLSVERAADDFDARRDARWRRYRYELLVSEQPNPFRRSYALHVPVPLDYDALVAAAAPLPGSHDFTAFTPTRNQHRGLHRREIRTARWARDGDRWSFTVEADSFLHHMVRVMVGTMLRVGRGMWEPARVRTLLDGRPRAEAGETAPARGLYLEAVGYGR